MTNHQTIGDKPFVDASVAFVAVFSTVVSGVFIELELVVSLVSKFQLSKTSKTISLILYPYIIFLPLRDLSKAFSCPLPATERAFSGFETGLIYKKNSLEISKNFEPVTKKPIMKNCIFASSYQKNENYVSW